MSPSQFQHAQSAMPASLYEPVDVITPSTDDELLFGPDLDTTTTTTTGHWEDWQTTLSPWIHDESSPYHWIPPPTSVASASASASAPASAAPFPLPNKPPYIMPTASALSHLEYNKLRAIAMPSTQPLRVSTDARSTPSASPPSRNLASSSSPETPRLPGLSTDGGHGTKRKVSGSGDEAGLDDEDGPPGKKTAHNMIEKRYRTNLNDKIATLRDAVPSLRAVSRRGRGGGGGDGHSDHLALGVDDLDGLAPANKLNKATVLSKATEYIHHLEKQNARLQKDNDMYQRRIRAFEQLFVSGSMAAPHPSMHLSPYQFPHEFINTGGPPTSLADPQGMIPVPEDMRRLHGDVGSQIYAIPQTHQVPRRNHHQQQPWQAGMLGKLMVGSLAGLMIMEGFREHEQDQKTPAARGLFALPGDVWSHLGQTWASLHPLGDAPATWDVTRKLKLFLVLGIALYIFLPSLLWPASTRSPPKVPPAAPVPPPSLAAPLHVRRQAWLTAIQTVWVPRHNFFLEAAALVLKMWKLSLRNAMGSRSYTLLTGTTEEQEKARVKSWTIALDALLAGGDVEVSKSRLTLTLLASATLPMTPQHLMLQALHIRVLFWETGHGIPRRFHHLISAWARGKWTAAQQLQQSLEQRQDPAAADLPEHLVALLTCASDAVLDDLVVQRAHNLTWNLPTTSGVTQIVTGMDEVVDDVAIRSPLDAVAAWYSGLTLHEVVMDRLSGPDTSPDAARETLELALATAPIGSTTRLRALAVRAVLDAQHRGAHIASTLTALAPEVSSFTSTHTHTNTSSHLPDVNLSLRCAMTMAHLERSQRAGHISETAQKLLATVTTQLGAQTQRHQLSLVGFLSAYELMQTLTTLPAVQSRLLPRLHASTESMAALLRLWMGGSDGARTGVTRATRNALVEGCLTVLRRWSGSADSGDDGYGSMSEGESQVGQLEESQIKAGC